MLRWITGPAPGKAKAAAKKAKAKVKKTAARVRVRRSDVSNSLRLGRNILRIA